MEINGNKQQISVTNENHKTKYFKGLLSKHTTTYNDFTKHSCFLLAYLLLIHLLLKDVYNIQAADNEDHIEVYSHTLQNSK